jgi:transposase
MYHRFKRKADARAYGQRWQAETANSMIKRNLGSAMRARSAVGRRHELLLRVLTHNIMLLAEGRAAVFIVKLREQDFRSTRFWF